MLVLTTGFMVFNQNPPFVYWLLRKNKYILIFFFCSFLIQTTVATLLYYVTFIKYFFKLIRRNLSQFSLTCTCKEFKRRLCPSVIPILYIASTGYVHNFTIFAASKYNTMLIVFSSIFPSNFYFTFKSI